MRKICNMRRKRIYIKKLIQKKKDKVCILLYFSQLCIPLGVHYIEITMHSLLVLCSFGPSISIEAFV